MQRVLFEDDSYLDDYIRDNPNVNDYTNDYIPERPGSGALND